MSQEQNDKLQELQGKSDELKQRISSFSSKPSTSNTRRKIRELVNELNINNEKISELLIKMIKNDELTKEEWDVDGVIQENVREEEDEEDEITYITQFSPIRNQPGAFIGNPGVLRTFGIFNKKMSDEKIRKILYNQQMQNYRVQEERKKRLEKLIEEEKLRRFQQKK